MSFPDFEAWSLFAAVAETGSFAAAARSRGLSVPTVSRAVARLETRLGASLFHRTSRRLSLSALGHEALPEAQALVAAAQLMEERLGESSATPSGMIKLAAPMDFGRTHLAPLLSEFLQAYPEISVDLHLSDARTDIVASGHDLVLRIGQLADSTLIARRLCSVSLLLVGAPSYLAAHGRPRHPSDLSKHRCLIYTNTVPVGVWRFHSPDGGDFSVTVSGPLQADSGATLLPAIVSGLGIGLLPDFMVSDDLRAGRLELLLENWRAPSAGAWLITPPNPLRPLRVRLLMDWLAERLHRPSWAECAGDQPAAAAP